MRKKITILLLTIVLSFALNSLINSNISIYFSKNTLNSANQISTNGMAQIAWADNGTPISIAAFDQEDPQICSDGAGGAIITWTDIRNGVTNYFDIYAQRIFANGSVAWTPGGVPICTASDYQVLVQICSDGAGGAIISWTDYRTDGYPTNPDVYARKINANGVPEWTSNGVPICTESNTQGLQQMCSDGAGGAIITWIDDRTAVSSYNIYAQRVLSTGVRDWTLNGELICPTLSLYPAICSDGSGGAIITWTDTSDGNYNIYAQKVNPSGLEQWTANGEVLCSDSNTQDEPQICIDGDGGAIIVWRDTRGSTDDIYARKINSSGDVEWTSNGVPICTAGGNQDDHQICSDGAGGAIITWDDGNIWAQKIDTDGVVKWTTNGKAICTATDTQQYAQICSDGAGGAIITWEDHRGPNVDIYAQKISNRGSLQWTINGHLICNADGLQEVPQICSDGAGGAIITWDDERHGDTFDDIYAQRIFDKSEDDLPLYMFGLVIPQSGGLLEEILGFFNDLFNTVVSIVLSPIVLGSIAIVGFLFIVILSSVISHHRKK